MCSWNIAPTRIQLTHVSPRVPVQEVKLTAVCRRLIVHLSSCAHRVCVEPAPSHHRSPAHAIHGYRCQCVCACLLRFSVAYGGIRAGHFGSRTDCLPDHHTFAPYSNMSRYAREYGQASSWYNRDWALPAMQHTKNSHSGWRTVMTGPVSGRTASQAARPRTMKEQPRLPLRQRLRSSRTATKITVVPSRTMP